MCRVVLNEHAAGACPCLGATKLSMSSSMLWRTISEGSITVPTKPCSGETGHSKANPPTLSAREFPSFTRFTGLRYSCLPECCSRHRSSFMATWRGSPPAAGSGANEVMIQRERFR